MCRTSRTRLGPRVAPPDGARGNVSPRRVEGTGTAQATLSRVGRASTSQTQPNTFNEFFIVKGSTVSRGKGPEPGMRVVLVGQVLETSNVLGLTSVREMHFQALCNALVDNGAELALEMEG